MLADFLYYFTSFVESEVKSNEVYTWNTDLKVVVLASITRYYVDVNYSLLLFFKVILCKINNIRVWTFIMILFCAMCN